MKRKVIFRPSAEADLQAIYEFIEQRNPEYASRFVGRIESYCLGFADFPERGTRRDDLRPGMRIVGFERRVLIAFTVLDETVEIAHILYGGRDISRGLRSD